jgi:class 3 adenylate cyclase/putative methionine-R-sulfoxide reductase with GAF domain
LTSLSEPPIGDNSALQYDRERDAATREILQVISNSRDNEQPVLECIVRNAALLCDAPDVGLHLVNETRTHFRLACVSEGDRGIFPIGEEFDLASPLQAATAIREARIIHTPNISDDPLYIARDPVRVRLVEEEGVRTYLSVPLVKDGIAFGGISLSRYEVKPFTESEIRLIETFAAQAVIAIENVRQFRELQARLEREAATREILQVISQSRADEQPVFEAILRNAARLLDSPAGGGLHLLNEARTHSRLLGSWGDDSGTFLIGTEFELAGTLPQSVAMRETRVVHTPDIKQSAIYLSGNVDMVKKADIDGVGTFLCVPLVEDGVAIGCFNLNRYDVKPYTEAEIALAETFAAQAVIAIENVHQFRKLQTRLEREAATREILQVISQSRADEKPVFDVILENASRLCNAPLAYLSMANEERTHVTVPAHRGSRPSFAADLDNLLVPIDGSELALVRSITECKVIRMDDLADTEMYRTREPNRVSMVENEGARSILVVPLISGGQGIGAIILYRREVAPFSDDDVALAESFAAQAVIAVENVKQFKALEARTEEVQALNAGLESRVAEQVGELERLGRLKRFLSPQVADAVVSSGDDKLLSSHRALIAVLFCDIRGFTAFCETAEPEETIEVLQTYHEEMGKLINTHGAGVDHRSGDGIMVIFNDPLPCDDPAGDALRMALAMRERMAKLCMDWRRLGHKLGFGVGISLGYATVGMVGSEGRYDYTASGTAVNLAARLCDEAADGEILLSPRAYAAVEDQFAAESTGEVSLKGIHAAVEVFRVTSNRAKS